MIKKHMVKITERLLAFCFGSNFLAQIGPATRRNCVRNSDRFGALNINLEVDGIQVMCSYRRAKGLYDGCNSVGFKWREEGRLVGITQFWNETTIFFGETISKDRQEERYYQILGSITPFIERVQQQVEIHSQALEDQEQKENDLKNDRFNQMFPDLSKVKEVGELAEYLISDNPRIRAAATTRAKQIACERKEV